MSVKETIYDFCKRQNRPLTGREIVDSIYPGKPQPYVNSYITQLVNEKKLIRDDSVKPYTVCMAIDNEEISVQNNSRNTDVSQIPVKARTFKRNTPKVDICKPCEVEVERYLAAWEQLENYRMQENALDKLFFYTYPNNSNIEEILVKVATLNDFYSTNIFSGYMVAKHILELNIDDRLNASDATLVNEIAEVVMNDGKTKTFYSFATKYCSHHKPFDYAIYDSYVDRVLRYFRKVDGFSDFIDEDLKNYVKFHKILADFQEFYHLEKYNLKLLDRYLWLLGKDIFPKKY